MGNNGVNRTFGDDEDGECETDEDGKRGEKGGGGESEREEEVTAGMHPTFDLFKWADRLSHEGAICFFLESFSYTPNPILSPILFLFLPLPRSISNGFHTAIVNVEGTILNKFDNILSLSNIIKSLLLYCHDI